MHENLEQSNYLDHLAELRKRLILVFLTFVVFGLVFFYFSGYLYSILLQPLSNVYKEQSRSLSLIYTALPEAFIANIKIAVFAALLFTLPIFFMQIYRFVVPALQKKEKKIFKFIFVSSPLLFFSGVCVAYFFVIPVAYRFFLGFEVVRGQEHVISMLPKLSEYLSISIKIILAFAICFQMPVILFIMLTLGVCEADTLKKGRRYMIVAVFALSALFTPPDPLSQVLLAFSLMALYELSIFSFRLIGR